MENVGLVRSILEGLEEGDWFENKHGVLFEWGPDRYQAINRWYQLDVNYVGPPAFQKEKSLPFTGIELYGLCDGVVYKAPVVNGPHVAVE